MALDKITKNNQFTKGPLMKVYAGWLNYVIDAINAMIPSLGTAKADTISEYTAAAGVTADGVKLKDSEVYTDVIREKTAAAGVTADGVLLKDSTVKANKVTMSTAFGTAAAGVTTVEYGDGRHITVTLSFTDLVLGAPTAGGNSAHGAIIYTLPATTDLILKCVACKVGLTVGTVQTDTPDVGLGSVIGSGAVATLDGTGTFEDIITGQTWNKTLDGTADRFASLFSGVVTEATVHPFNMTTAEKKIHLNVADGWAAGVTGNLTATGTIVLEYVVMIP